MASDPRPDSIRLTDAEKRARRNRSLAIGAVLVGLVVVFYIITLFRMGSGGA